MGAPAGPGGRRLIPGRGMTELGEYLALLVGHPRPGSRTHAVAARTGELLRQSLAAEQISFPEPVLVDLAVLAPFLLDRGPHGGAGGRAVRIVRQAALLVTVTPTFRAAPSGLLKFFFDLMPAGGLAGSVAVPLATAGLPTHQPVVDRSLRSLLSELHAQVPSAGIGVLESDLARFDDIFGHWWRAEGPCLSSSLSRLRKAPINRPARPAAKGKCRLPLCAYLSYSAVAEAVITGRRHA
jgi:FMN reductase